MSKETKIEGAATVEDLAALKISATAEDVRLKLSDLVLRNNVRDVEEYNLPPLIESFKKNGFRPSSRIVVHVGDDKQYEVLAGNRRTNALRSLTPEELLTVLAATGGLVPCVVYRSLTPAQQEILRCDHGADEDREPLSKWGLFVAVCRLLIANISQAAIAERLSLFIVKDGQKKPNRSLVQVYAAAAALPDRVKLMLKDYWMHSKGTIKQSDIMPLSKLWNEEWPTFGINGHEGPKFRAKVQEILDRNTDQAVATTKSLTVSAATDRAKVMTSPVTRKLLTAAVQSDGSALAELDKELSARDRIFAQVDWLFQNKPKTIQKLLDEAQAALDEEAAKQAAKDAADAEANREKAVAPVLAQPTA